MRAWLWFLFASLLTCSAGCLHIDLGPAFEARSKDYLLRVDEASDTIELLSIHYQLRSDGDHASKHLAALVAGSRVLPADGGFPSFDIDGFLSLPPESAEPENDSDLRMLFEGTQVVECVLGLDSEGKVTLWRHLRFQRAADILARLPVADPDPKAARFELGKYPTFDERTLELANAADDRGERFMTLHGDSLVIDMPSSPFNAARVMAHWAQDAADGDVASTLVLTNLRELENSAERLRLRVGPDESGWMRSTKNSRLTASDQAGAYLTASKLESQGLYVESSAEFAARLARVVPPRSALGAADLPGGN